MCVKRSQLGRFCVSNTQGACVSASYTQDTRVHICTLTAVYVCVHPCHPGAVCVCLTFHTSDVGMQMSAPQNLTDVSAYVP